MAAKFMFLPIILVLAVSISHQRGKAPRGCKNPKGKFGQWISEDCSVRECKKTGKWETCAAPAKEATLEKVHNMVAALLSNTAGDVGIFGLNYASFGYSPGYGYTPDTFKAFNVLTEGVDKWDDTTEIANYWLSSGGETGPICNLYYSIGTKMNVKGFAIKNTNNAGYGDRGTANFTISSKESQEDSWTVVITDTLQDASGITNVPVELFTLPNAISARFLLFTVDSYYGVGGGLQYFAPV